MWHNPATKYFSSLLSQLSTNFQNNICPIIKIALIDIWENYISKCTVIIDRFFSYSKVWTVEMVLSFLLNREFKNSTILSFIIVYNVCRFDSFFTS